MLILVSVSYLNFSIQFKSYNFAFTKKKNSSCIVNFRRNKGKNFSHIFKEKCYTFLYF